MLGMRSHTKDVHKSTMCKPECQFINLQRQTIVHTDLSIENSFPADLHGKLLYNQKIATIESRQGELVAQFKYIVAFDMLAPTTHLLYGD